MNLSRWAVSAVVLASSAALADDGGWRVTLEPYGRHAFDADLDDGGSVAVSRAGVDLFVDKPFSEGTFGRLKVMAEYSHYDFDGVGGTALLDDGLTVEIRPSLSTYFSPDLGVYGGLILGAGGDPDADLGDALYYGGYIGFNYQITPGVWIGTGVGVQTELEDDLLFVPLFTLDLKLTDRLTLSADGLSGRLTYEIDEEWDLFLDARYEYRQFRLDDDALVPDGVLRDQVVPISLGVTWKPTDALSLTAAGGVTAWRNLEVREEDENELASTDTDTAGFVSVVVKWVF